MSNAIYENKPAINFIKSVRRLYPELTSWIWTH